MSHMHRKGGVVGSRWGLRSGQGNSTALRELSSRLRGHGPGGSANDARVDLVSVVIDTALRDQLSAARYSDEASESIAALDEMNRLGLYDLVLDALLDEKSETREHAASLATGLLDADALDLTQLPTEVKLSVYFGEPQLDALRMVAGRERDNVAGVLGRIFAEVRRRLCAMSNEDFEAFHPPTAPPRKIGLVVSGELALYARLLAWKFGCSPARVLQVVALIGSVAP